MNFFKAFIRYFVFYYLVKKHFSSVFRNFISMQKIKTFLYFHKKILQSIYPISWHFYKISVATFSLDFPSFSRINVSIVYSISAMSRKKRVLRARQKSTWTLTNATRHVRLGRGRSRTLGERRLVGLTQFPLPTRSHPATACSSSREQEHRNALEAAFRRRSTWYSRYLPSRPCFVFR